MSFGSMSLPPPTASESARIEAAKARGCIACLMDGAELEFCGPPEYHHLLVNGLRVGHRFGVCLGSWAHRGVILPDFVLPTSSLRKATAAMLELYGPSLHHNKRAFEACYGKPQALLDYQDDLLRLPRVKIQRQRTGKSTATPAKVFPR